MRWIERKSISQYSGRNLILVTGEVHNAAQLEMLAVTEMNAEIYEQSNLATVIKVRL